MDIHPNKKALFHNMVNGREGMVGERDIKKIVGGVFCPTSQVPNNHTEP